MRRHWWGLFLVAWCALAVAGPKPKAPPKAPPGLPPEQAEIIKLQQDLAQLQVKQQYVPAIKIARRILELEIKLHGKDDRQVGYAKQSLASLLAGSGDYVEALKIDKELVAAAEKEHGPESREVQYALLALSGVYQMQQRYDELEPINQRMIAIVKKLDGENSMTYASELTRDAAFLDMHNEYTAAQRMYEQALKIYEAIKKDDSELMGPLQSLAYSYWSTNQRPKAIALWDREVKIVEASAKIPILSKGSTMWAIASAFHYGNRDDLAKPLIKRAMDLYDAEIARLEKSDPTDYQLTTMLGMSGYLLQQTGDYAGAEKRFEKAMALDAKRPGFTGQSAWGGALAEVKRAEGKPKEALALIEAQYAAAKGAAWAYVYDMSMSFALRQMGDYKRAIALLVDYRDKVEKQWGKKSAMYGMAELQLAFAYMGSGDIGTAEKLLAESLELSEKELQLVLKVGTDADHAVYFAKNAYLLDTAVNFNFKLAPKGGLASRLGLTTLLRRKGRALDAAAASLATIRAKLSPEDKQLLDELASARAKLAKLTVAGPSAVGDPAEYAKEVAALEDQVAKLELAIGKKSAAYRAATVAIDLAPIQKLIPKDAKLVEIVNFQPGDPKVVWTPTMVNPPRRYAAYVLGQTGDPVLVDFGEAAPIDDAVAKFRKAVADPDNDRANELGHALYDLTVAKLEPALGKATEILIAPDGTLNVVPFSALTDGKGKFLVERFTFTYLTSGRDLLRIAVRTKAQGGGVIFADPSFDSTGKAGGDAAKSRGRRSADLASLSWPRLPGTNKEANAVVKTMPDLKLVLGADANEAAVKAIHGPKILHLATHGFFLPDEAPPPGANDNAPAMPGIPAQGAAPVGAGYENPLLRSGLALAGANKLGPSGGEGEDGILTALEASGLDLEGTKLVVLSACETGVGKVTNGDGVYGLRRALVVAGAESLVMSLWQVDDEATKELMVGYYARLAKGESRSTALRDVQLQLMHEGKYKHPYYWASFLPAGDNSPIKE